MTSYLFFSFFVRAMLFYFDVYFIDIYILKVNERIYFLKNDNRAYSKVYFILFRNLFYFIFIFKIDCVSNKKM